VLPPPPSLGGALIPDLPAKGLTDLFTERLTSIDGYVHPVAPSDAADGIAALIAGYEAREYLAWDEDAIGVHGLLARLADNGVVRISADVPNDTAARIAHQATYRSLTVGITGADAGLAESGSLVLVSGPGRSRMASLIPYVHIAVLRTSRIVRTLGHLLNERPELTGAGSNFVIVTGPSRTGDIEMVLTLGVHGPRHVHVVMIDD
jgi:L-lactate dehydrogenase complex protein LldG